MEQKMNIPLDGTPINVEHVFAAYPDIIHFDVDVLFKQAAFFRWPGTTLISCTLTLDNGHTETDDARPRDDSAYTDADGIRGAFMKARNKCWGIKAYLDRSKKA